jgi:hypothetical protein
MNVLPNQSSIWPRLCKQRKTWQRSELTDVTAKVVIYEAFIEGGLEAPRHLARTVHDCSSSRSTRSSGREQFGVFRMPSPRHSKNWIPFLNSRRRRSWASFWIPASPRLSRTVAVPAGPPRGKHFCHLFARIRKSLQCTSEHTVIERPRVVNCGVDSTSGEFNHLRTLSHRGLSGESLIRAWFVIQFTSQVLPPSSEYDCSKWAEFAVMSDQTYRIKIIRPL